MSQRLMTLGLAGAVLAVAFGCGAGPGNVTSHTDSSDIATVGTWRLAEDEDPTPTSTMIAVLVTRLACASGETGQVEKPAVRYEADRIVIRTDVVHLEESVGYNCQENEEVPMSIRLDEKLGTRALVDEACLIEPAVDTAPCIEGAQRWPASDGSPQDPG